MINISEHDEQKKLIKWWEMYSSSKGIPKELFFAIPNGGKRDVITAKVLQSEGVRPGVPDLFLALETYTHAGLFIEMKKAKGGVVSDKQRAFAEMLENHTSYQHKVCRGFDEARLCVERYITTGEA
jgi:hypothetical protein